MVLVLLFRQLFEGIQAAGPRASFTVRAQFLEIYNEEVKDLLAPSATNRSIAIRECPDGQIVVTGGLLLSDQGRISIPYAGYLPTKPR